MKTILVDNHPATLRGLRLTLEDIEDVEVVGEAKNAEEALRLAEDLRPDLVILDLDLGVGSGLDVCRELKSSPRPPRVLFYTAHNSRDDVVSISLANADGYLYKGLEIERLSEVVEGVRAGERLWMIGPGNGHHAPGLTERIERAELTRRERQVLDLLLINRTNREIAERLYLSHNTAKHHVRSILKKLDVNSRRELVG